MRRLVTVILVSASAAACTTDGGDSIIVLKNVAPGAGCTLASTTSEPFISHGTLDISMPSAYTFSAQMKSRILMQADPNAGTGSAPDLDAKTIFMRSANVDLAFPSSAVDLSSIPTTLTHFKKLFSAELPPESLVDAQFELIPADLTKAIIALNPQANIEVEATFTVIGDLGGDQVSSQPFIYPVTLGIGISKNVVGMCPLAAGTIVRTGGTCNSAQDGVVDCCMDSSTATTPTCPATVAAM